MEFSARLFVAGTRRRTDLRVGFEFTYGFFVGAGMTARKNHMLRIAVCKRIRWFFAFIKCFGFMGLRAARVSGGDLCRQAEALD